MTTQHAKRAPVIAVEGAIGAGKSTLLRWVRAEYAHVVGDEYASSLLPRYFADPSRWALATQIDSLVGRVQLGRAAQRIAHTEGTGAVWLDRSVLGDAAFARANHATGRLTPEEYRVYADARDALTLPLPDVVVFLAVPYELSSARQRARGTAGEVIPQDYAAALEAAYTDVLADAESRGVPVFRAGMPHAPDPQAYSVTARHLVDTLWEFLEARNSPH